MNEPKNKTKCAEGYVQDGSGGCIDPNDLGGGDGTAGNFMGDVYVPSKPPRMCDDVICPPGQHCHETVFGFTCV